MDQGSKALQQHCRRRTRPKQYEAGPPGDARCGRQGKVAHALYLFLLWLGQGSQLAAAR